MTPASLLFEAKPKKRLSVIITHYSPEPNLTMEVYINGVKHDYVKVDRALEDRVRQLIKKNRSYEAIQLLKPYHVNYKKNDNWADLYTQKELEDLEEFTIKDFKFQGSSLTKKFRKERNKVRGQEVKVAKLVDFDFNTNRAVFLTKPTFKNSVQMIDPKDNQTFWDSMYTMEVQFIDLEKWKSTPWKELTLKDFREILTVCDIKLFCDCPAHTWQGHRYNLSQIDSSIYPINIPDPVWRVNHNGKGGLCKHLLGLTNDFGMMSSVILSQIKKKAVSKNIDF